MVVVGHDDEARRAVRILHDVHAFHVIDLVGHACLEQDFAVHDRAGPDISATQAADAHAHTFGKIEAAFEQQEVAIGQERAVCDIERGMVGNGEGAFQRSLQDCREKIAIRIDAFFRNDNESATEWRRARRYRQRFQAAIVAQLVIGDEVRQSPNRFCREKSRIGINIDPVALLVTHENLAVTQREALGIHVHLAWRFATAHVQHRRDTGLGNARQRTHRIAGDPARQPMTGVQHRNKVLTVGAEPNGGYRTEQFLRRAHHHAADEFQFAEAFRARADLEAGELANADRHIDSRSADRHRKQRDRHDSGHRQNPARGGSPALLIPHGGACATNRKRCSYPRRELPTARSSRQPVHLRQQW
ncbi:Hypothetical protein AT6N2_L0397 [Agrobacterium tumefaciens]|nr:Hypothetical protein AT6N2_L0397 [Agrobacterium tumefaciens]